MEKKKKKVNPDKELMRQLLDDMLIYSIAGYQYDDKGNITKLTIGELLELQDGTTEEGSNEG
jgi:hypothetical protein